MKTEHSNLIFYIIQTSLHSSCIFHIIQTTLHSPCLISIWSKNLYTVDACFVLSFLYTLGQYVIYLATATYIQKVVLTPHHEAHPMSVIIRCQTSNSRFPTFSLIANTQSMHSLEKKKYSNLHLDFQVRGKH